MLNEPTKNIQYANNNEKNEWTILEIVISKKSVSGPTESAHSFWVFSLTVSLWLTRPYSRAVPWAEHQLHAHHQGTHLFPPVTSEPLSFSISKSFCVNQAPYTPVMLPHLRSVGMSSGLAFPSSMEMSPKNRGLAPCWHSQTFAYNSLLGSPWTAVAPPQSSGPESFKLPALGFMTFFYIQTVPSLLITPGPFFLDSFLGKKSYPVPYHAITDMLKVATLICPGVTTVQATPDTSSQLLTWHPHSDI